MNNLEQFFSCYFHQDCFEENEDPKHILQMFIESTPETSALSDLAQSLSEMLVRFPSDEDLGQALLDDFGCYYDPKCDYGRNEDWIRNLIDTLNQEIRLRRCS